MKTKKFFSFSFLLALLIVGCNAKPANNTSSPTPAVAKTPVVSSDKGALKITLIYKQNGNPVRGQTIYLAKMLPAQGQNQDIYVPALDMSTAPAGESSGSGDVVISLVPAGKYALAIFTPTQPVLVLDAATNKEIIIDIVANQISDLGKLEVLLDPNLLEPLTK